MQYRYRSEHASKDYACDKELSITKYERGLQVQTAQKEVVKETTDGRVHAKEYIQRVQLHMKNDEAIKLRDKLIEAYPIKDEKV